MVLTSIDFDDSKSGDFYRYEIGKLTTDFSRRAVSCLFDVRTLDKIYNSPNKELFALYGIMIDIIKYPYIKQVLLAISDSIDELSILADLRGLAPIVNKV